MDPESFSKKALIPGMVSATVSFLFGLVTLSLNQWLAKRRIVDERNRSFIESTLSKLDETVESVTLKIHQCLTQPDSNPILEQEVTFRIKLIGSSIVALTGKDTRLDVDRLLDASINWKAHATANLPRNGRGPYSATSSELDQVNRSAGEFKSAITAARASLLG